MSLPKHWSKVNKGPNIVIGDDQLSVALEKDLEKSECVTTSNPIPFKCTHYYFEIQILSVKGSDGISMGISTKSSSPNDEKNDEILSPEIGYALGMKVGCFIDFGKGFCFFTLDGKIANEFISISVHQKPYYPTVKLRSAGASVIATFKKKKCLFKVEGNKDEMT